MTGLVIVLGLVIEALNEENIQGALKIECLSKEFIYYFIVCNYDFFPNEYATTVRGNTFFRRYTN